MSDVEPRDIHLSASAISAFKACPKRYYFAYNEGIRPIEDTDGLRMGTNWHSLHENYRESLGVGDTPETAFAGAIDLLNELYQTIPETKTVEEWATERAVLAGSFAAWIHLMPEPAKTLVTELQFELPLPHPLTGLPVAGVKVLGKIDRLVRLDENRVGMRDYKSTSKPISADSLFWSHLRLDTQISLYVYAARELQRRGELRQYGVKDDDEIVAFYDVWHKPTIAPKKLTQADTAAFVESGEYMGQTFDVQREDRGREIPEVLVNGIDAEIEVGKKGFAIRETPDMFGQRLISDIFERPDFYFASREIARTQRDMEVFSGQLYHICQSIKAMRHGGHWFQNEHQCEASFRCPYIPLCYSHVETEDGSTPAGFKRIFTNLTVEQETIET